MNKNTKTIPLGFVVTVALSAPAMAGQPISNSMAECSAIYAASSVWVTTPAKVARLEMASGRWAEAALAQAHAEGRGNPAAHVDRVRAEKSAEWIEKGVQVVYSDDFRDWMGYCRSLARNRGLVIDPG